MRDGSLNLGRQMVRAARLAVAVRRYESALGHVSPGGEALHIAGQLLRQRVATGGAGQRAAGEDTPRPADLVTDDERHGLTGHDADPRDAAGR